MSTKRTRSWSTNTPDSTRLQRRPVVCRLEGGPADGAHVTVPSFGLTVWQRTAHGEPWHARYEHDPSRRGVYVFVGEIVSNEQLAVLVRASAQRERWGVTMGA